MQGNDLDTPTICMYDEHAVSEFEFWIILLFYIYAPCTRTPSITRLAVDENSSTFMGRAKGNKSIVPPNRRVRAVSHAKGGTKALINIDEFLHQMEGGGSPRHRL